MSNISIPAAKLVMYDNYAPVKNTYLQLQYMHTGKRDRFDSLMLQEYITRVKVS